MADGAIATQVHLDNAMQGNLRFDGDAVERDRQNSHAFGIPHKPEYPDVYINKDVTVTVDPVGNKQWIVDDAARHHLSEHRGRSKDHAEVDYLLGKINIHEPPRYAFEPKSAMLDKSHKFSAKCVANSTRGNVAIGRQKDADTLPVISKLIWEDRLPRVPDWYVDKAVQMERNTPNRAFDCDGWCR
jgi:hypothetical protein